MNVIFTLTVVFFLTLSANAKELPNADADGIADGVEAYLNNVENFTADFRQVGADGSVASGKFYLQRPGKFRWEYDESQPLLIMSNGERLVYFDKDLEEVTYIGVQDTLAGFLARDVIKFEDDITLVDYETAKGFIKATITQTEKPDEGTLVMVFKMDAATQEPTELVGLQVQDPYGGGTLVSFQNRDFQTAIAEDKFIFRDPNFHKNVWE